MIEDVRALSSIKSQVFFEAIGAISTSCCWDGWTSWVKLGGKPNCERRFWNNGWVSKLASTSSWGSENNCLNK